MSTLFNSAFSFAVFKASGEISIAETCASGRFFFKLTGIQPLPVPTSKKLPVANPELPTDEMIHSTNSSVGNSGLATGNFLDVANPELPTDEMIHSTNSSVSGRGINTDGFTLKERP